MHIVNFNANVLGKQGNFSLLEKFKILVVFSMRQNTACYIGTKGGRVC